jgi:outer membrane protein TolC
LFLKNPVCLFCLVLLGAVLFPGCSHREAVRDVSSLETQTPGDLQAVPHPAPADIPPESPSASSSVLTLDRAVEEALAASPELEQIKRRIEAASEQVRQAESYFYPKLIVTEDYGLTNEPGQAFMYIINQRRFLPSIDFNEPGVQQDLTTRVQGEIQFFSGGADWYGRKAAQAGRRAVSAELRAACSQLVSRVSETYLKWLQALGFIGVAQRALDSAEVSEQMGVARVRAQTALPSEIARLKANTAEAQSDLICAKTGARRLQAAIERLIARSLNPDETPRPEIELQRPGREPPAGTPKELVDRALQSRAETASAAALIDAARERVRASRSGLLPKISSNAFHEWNGEGFGNMLDSWFAGIHAT